MARRKSSMDPAVKAMLRRMDKANPRGVTARVRRWYWRNAEKRREYGREYMRYLRDRAWPLPPHRRRSTAIDRYTAEHEATVTRLLLQAPPPSAVH